MWFLSLLGCMATDIAESPIAVLSDPTAALHFEVDDASSITLVLRGEAFVSVDRIEGPGEELYWEDWIGEEQRTSAVFAQQGETVLVWPVEAGAWTIEVSTTNDVGEALPGVALAGRLIQKTGRGGTLRVTLRTSTGIEVPTHTIRRLERVLKRAGLTLDLQTNANSLPAIVPDDDAVLTDASTAPGLVVWLASSIPGNALAHTGNIPASSLPGPRSVITVSMDLAAGTDGVFSTDEAEALGDTIAHEIGHFLGLFHPVELSFDRYDAVDDTPRCGDRSACEAALGANLMFPWPVDGGLPRTTQEQRALLRLHQLVR